MANDELATPPDPPSYINFRSLTFLSGLGACILGAYLIYAGELESGAKTVMAGLTAIGLRRAVEAAAGKQ